MKAASAPRRRRNGKVARRHGMDETWESRIAPAFGRSADFNGRLTPSDPRSASGEGSLKSDLSVAGGWQTPAPCHGLVTGGVWRRCAITAAFPSGVDFPM